VRTTYTVELIIELDSQLLHGVQNDLEGAQDVVEYDCTPFVLFRPREALGVDQSHLLQDRRLAGLSRTWTTRDKLGSSSEE